MKPPVTKKEFEKVPTDDFVIGEIEEIEYDNTHLFKGYAGNEDRIKSAVRLKFKIDGCAFPHRSNWMSFNYSEKSNLFNKFIVPLVEDAEPNMDFDLDRLKGMKVKMLWAEKNGFQYPETIRPIGKKVESLPSIQMEEPKPDDEVHF